MAVLMGCSKMAEATLQDALVEAGARPAVAACMAERMTDRLSLVQLQKLQRLRPEPGEKTTGLTSLEVIERVRRVGDAEVIAVTARAGAACALRV
jgi:hypothetical protein